MCNCIQISQNTTVLYSCNVSLGTGQAFVMDNPILSVDGRSSGVGRTLNEARGGGGGGNFFAGLAWRVFAGCRRATCRSALGSCDERMAGFFSDSLRLKRLKQVTVEIPSSSFESFESVSFTCSRLP